MGDQALRMEKIGKHHGNSTGYKPTKKEVDELLSQHPDNADIEYDRAKDQAWTDEVMQEREPQEAFISF